MLNSVLLVNVMLVAHFNPNFAVGLLCPVKLPAAPSSLRPQKTNESCPLSEFQEELLTLGSSLKGHLPPLTECNTVKKAHAYVTDAVDNFFKAASAASKAGLPSDTKFQLNLPAQPVSS